MVNSGVFGKHSWAKDYSRATRFQMDLALAGNMMLNLLLNRKLAVGVTNAGEVPLLRRLTHNHKDF